MFQELEFQLDDGRMVYFDATYKVIKSWEGADADGNRGVMETLIEDMVVSNVFVEGVAINELHPDDQAEVNGEIEKYLSRWVPND